MIVMLSVRFYPSAKLILGRIAAFARGEFNVLTQGFLTLDCFAQPNDHFTGKETWH